MGSRLSVKRNQIVFRLAQQALSKHKLEVVSTLGEGEFGVVFKAVDTEGRYYVERHQRTGHVVAVKVAKPGENLDDVYFHTSVAQNDVSFAQFFAYLSDVNAIVM